MKKQNKRNIFSLLPAADKWSDCCHAVYVYFTCHGVQVFPRTHIHLYGYPLEYQPSDMTGGITKTVYLWSHHADIHARKISGSRIPHTFVFMPQTNKCIYIYIQNNKESLALKNIISTMEEHLADCQVVLSISTPDSNHLTKWMTNDICTRKSASCQGTYLVI